MCGFSGCRWARCMCIGRLDRAKSLRRLRSSAPQFRGVHAEQPRLMSGRCAARGRGAPVTRPCRFALWCLAVAGLTARRAPDTALLRNVGNQRINLEAPGPNLPDGASSQRCELATGGFPITVPLLRTETKTLQQLAFPAALWDPPRQGFIVGGRNAHETKQTTACRYKHVWPPELS